MSEASEYPNLKDTTTEDLVLLLACYIKEPAIAKMDSDFIKAIQTELKTRKPIPYPIAERRNE